MLISGDQCGSIGIAASKGGSCKILLFFGR
jgi:hypothetical protein